MARASGPLYSLPVSALLVALSLGTASRSLAATGPGDAGLVLAGAVTRIKDGDTANVRLDGGAIEVRLYGIDTPEARAPFGREATRALEALVGQQPVELMPVSQDRYERMVAVVLVGGRSVNESLLAAGWAWAYRDYLGQVPGDERYCELEAEARSARRGLWSQSPDRWVPPWVYRRRQRAEPGARVPARDYSQETAADCRAEVRKARARRQQETPAPESPASDCRIKGNINAHGRKIYHLPGSGSYAATRINPLRGERWFCTEAEARAAGWTPAH